MRTDYRLAISKMIRTGKFHEPSYNCLVKAGVAASKPLVRELLSNPDANVRHVCAHLLGDRGYARAVPALIEALKDREKFVRQDAFWAIERLCRFQAGGLQDFLSVSPHTDNSAMLYRKTSSWWRINKKFIERNSQIW
jgi:HEAT repeat protein